MSTVRRRGVPVEIWVLVAAAFVIAIGYGIVAPVLPEFARSFNVGVTAASAVVSAFAGFRLLFAPASGALVSRFGERPTYLAGLGIVALSTLATAFAPSYPLLIAFRALGGIGSTMFTVSAMGLIVRLTPPPIRGRVSSMYATAFLLGGVLGPVVGGVLAEVSLRAPFLVYAGALVVAMAVVWWFLPAHSRSDDEVVAARPAMTFREALVHPTYRAALVSQFANGWTNFGVRVAHVPLLVGLTLAASPWVAGAAMAVFALGNALSVNIGGRLADVRGRRPMVLIGLAVCGAATAVFGLAHNPAMVLVLSLIAGAGVGFFGPAQQASVADIIGNERSGGQVLSSFQMSADLGAIIGPLLGGMIAERWGFEWAFGVSGALMLASMVLWVPAPETRPGRAS